jgi:diguanylate cyclase (GGDEF)-like protein
MLVQPQPRFFYTDTDDLFIGGLMLSLNVVALSVVPIVARGVFLGILTVSVAERPERLHPDSDLLERLTGVAALAAPAIQNGQLVDELNHKANHDDLTGLLNRVGFKHRIDAALDSVAGHPDDSDADGQADAGSEVGADNDGTGQVGLLFVDLNDFKRINDLHGHEAGDELIRQAAARLSSLCRGDDDVARLGGDEFAIVLMDVHRDEQVRAAERRVREAFTEPLTLGAGTISVSASVGGGVWPDDGNTVSELIRYADAAMYVDKAKSRGAAPPAAAWEPVR